MTSLLTSPVPYILIQHAYFFCNTSTNTTNPTQIPCLNPLQPQPAVPAGIPEQEAKQDNQTSRPPGFGDHSVHTGLYTWNEARVCCERGGHLAIINSVAEAEAIMKLIIKQGGNKAWIGAHDLYQEGQFVTIHGDTLPEAGYDVWLAGEPNNLGNNENCVTLESDGKLNDQPCTTRFFHVCESPHAL